MSNPGSSQETADAGSQQAGAPPVAGFFTRPEAVWLPFIRDMYPNLHGQTYFLPPFHFYRTPYSVATIAGQTVRVVDNPPCIPRKRRRRPPRFLPSYPPPSVQLMGTVFTENPATLQPVHIQDSDFITDEAQQRCLQALKDIPSQVMMVISHLIFRKYLDNVTNPQRITNPLHAAAIAQLPRIDRSIPSLIADGECDILIIHRDHGLIAGEIKSLGNWYFYSRPVNEQSQVIVRAVQSGITQLTNQEMALRHLVSDLAPIRITKVLLLPNIKSAQLQQALDTNPVVAQELCQCMNSFDVSQAVNMCLCADHLGQPSTWWNKLLTQGPDPCMSPSVYERLVARFCGPATTVEIPTVTPPRLVVRSQGQAVAETGLRFSSLALTPAQVDLLNRQPEPRGMYLQGPPGCGKTVVLVLKALQWAQRGETVHIVCVYPEGRAVSALLEQQLRSCLGGAVASAVHRHCYDINTDDVSTVVSNLVALVPAGCGPLHIIIDEINWSVRGEFHQLLTALHSQVADITLWMAGVWHLDSLWPLPSWLSVYTLDMPLRCPPAVTREVQQSAYVDRYIPSYCAPVQPAATEGTVRWLYHKNQPGHTGDYPLNCVSCADLIADILTQLRVGHPDHGLQYKDVWILCDRGPSSTDAMVQRLQCHHRIPVRVVTRPVSEADARELALATTDQNLERSSTVLCKLLRRHCCQAVGALAFLLDYIRAVERGDPLHGQQLISLIPLAHVCTLESTLEP